MEIEVAGRTFSFPDEILTLRAADEPEIIDAYFAEKKEETAYEIVTGKETEYKVVKGDFLAKIASKNGVTLTKLRKDNKLTTNDVQIGQSFRIIKEDTKKEIGKKVLFNRLNKATLGQEVYILVKTECFQEKTLKINIKQGKEKGIVEKDKNITVQQNDKDVAIVKATTGDYCNTDYHNKDDYGDYAIAKITLQPKDKDKQKLWNDNLKDLKDKKTKLYLLIDAHTDYSDLEIEYHGRNPKEDGSADTTTVKNYWLDMDGKWFELKKNQRAPWMEIVYNEMGVEEIKGKKHNSKILDYHEAAKFTRSNVTDDSNWPWCASFASWVMKKDGHKLPLGCGKATNWKNWGKADSKDKPIYGSIAVIDWGKNDNGKGHIAFFIGKIGKDYYLLGGNQNLV